MKNGRCCAIYSAAKPRDRKRNRKKRRRPKRQRRRQLPRRRKSRKKRAAKRQEGRAIALAAANMRRRDVRRQALMRGVPLVRIARCRGGDSLRLRALFVGRRPARGQAVQGRKSAADITAREEIVPGAVDLVPVGQRSADGRREAAAEM